MRKMDSICIQMLHEDSQTFPKVPAEIQVQFQFLVLGHKRISSPEKFKMWVQPLNTRSQNQSRKLKTHVVHSLSHQGSLQ